MKYLVNVRPYGKSAGNKGLIGNGFGPYAENFVFEAASDAEAYQELLKLFQQKDRRPIAGKSYLSKCRQNKWSNEDRTAARLVEEGKSKLYIHYALACYSGWFDREALAKRVGEQTADEIAMRR
jgi:hypothetical protein